MHAISIDQAAPTAPLSPTSMTRPETSTATKNRLIIVAMYGRPRAMNNVTIVPWKTRIELLMLNSSISNLESLHDALQRADELLAPLALLMTRRLPLCLLAEPIACSPSRLDVLAELARKVSVRA